MQYVKEMTNAIEAAEKCEQLASKKVCVEFDDIYFYNCGCEDIAVELIGAKLARTNEEFETRSKNMMRIIQGSKK